MKKRLVLVLGAALLLTACGEEAAKMDSVTPATIEQNSESEIDKEHAANVALDYAGDYKGQIPCADCSGIDVELTLSADNNYIYQMTYLDVKGKDETTTEKGRFTWNKAGQVVTLDGTTGGPDGAVRYFVGENVLFPADKDGKIIKNESQFDYSLHKVLPE